MDAIGGLVRIEDCAAPYVVPDDALVGEAELVREGEAGEDVSEIVVEGLLGAEDQPARVRVQPVRADHEVEAAAGAAFEHNVDGVPVVVQGGDGVLEEELDPVAQRLVEGVGQIAAPDLQVEAGLAAGHLLGAQRADGLPDGVDEGDSRGVDVGGAQSRQQPHALHDRAGGAADVDGVATPAYGGGLLQDGHLEAVSVEPICERRARDARSGDQYATGGA